MIKSPLKGSGLKLNVYVAPIGGIHLAECDFGTPRIGDDNNTVTWSVYELKFSATTY